MGLHTATNTRLHTGGRVNVTATVPTHQMQMLWVQRSVACGSSRSAAPRELRGVSQEPFVVVSFG